MKVYLVQGILWKIFVIGKVLFLYLNGLRSLLTLVLGQLFLVTNQMFVMLVDLTCLVYQFAVDDQTSERIIIHFD